MTEQSGVHPGARRSASRRAAWWVAGALFVSGLALLFAWELTTSHVQSIVISRYAADIDHWMEPGANSGLRFPAGGPFDRRAGYSELPRLLPRLAASGFVVTEQARTSARFDQVVDHGLFPIYAEKAQTGLTISDRHGHALFAQAYPQRALPGFDAVPPLLVNTLLYVENRELLDARRPYRNPAVEWDRLATVALHVGRRSLGDEAAVPGASTLATQLEKFRHSRGGLTQTAAEKLAQMASASLRAYHGGRETLAAQQRIVVDYLNGLPLAAIPNHGEIHGLLDGLALWYGIEPDELGLLREPVTADRLQRAAYVYRAALSLIIATRRPALYLTREDDGRRLTDVVDVYVQLLARQNVVPDVLANAARDIVLERRSSAPSAQGAGFVEQKAANAVRTSLLGVLGVSSLYELDRLDLRVATSIDGTVQADVVRELMALGDPERRSAAGLSGARLLPARGSLPVTYSLLLCEATPEGNVVRVQADTFDGPRDVNRNTKLELGSTAKLRTLVSYLQTVESLHEELKGQAPAALAAYLREFTDPLTQWVGGLLSAEPTLPLEAALDAALQRRYSASRAERFFTAGGLHYFSNFDDTYDASAPTVQEAFSQSINLVFVRLMRDVVRYHEQRLPFARDVVKDTRHPERAQYLARFADREGEVFTRRFHRKHAGLAPAASVDAVLRGRASSPLRAARAHLAVLPESSSAALGDFLAERFPHDRFSADELAALRRRAAGDTLPLTDVAYLAGVHPLEIWTARHLARHPEASLLQTIEASAAARQEAYGWLFRTRRTAAQDERIRIMLEADAFEAIHADWQKLGYPFRSLVPSYATALGSSGDTPGALAELIGIIVNDGVRRPFVQIEALRFAEGTPFETRLQRADSEEPRVLSAAVAHTAKAVLADVIANGTGRRVRDAFTGPHGTPLAIGGKTGTGDNQHVVVDARGSRVASHARSRTAALVFFVGNHFGIVTAHVDGSEAADFDFTSALPAQLLRHLAPVLQPLFDHEPRQDARLAELAYLVD